MNNIHYQWLDASQAATELTSLVHVLSACVAQDASVGFISLDPQPMRTFWQGVVSSLARGEQQLLVARQNGTLVGTVIVGLGMMPNGQHRAEISKLLVHPYARRQGIAWALLDGAEVLAKQAGRTLLVLDTRSGDIAEHIYRRAGWLVSGQIPGYALSPAGVLDATTVMYKFLSPA